MKDMLKVVVLRTSLMRHYQRHVLNSHFRYPEIPRYDLPVETDEKDRGIMDKDYTAAAAERRNPAPKRRRKWLIVLGVALAVAAVSGAGFWVWHETPSFCGTMCHDTMGSYLDTYENSDFLVKSHADADVACLDCHEAELATQMAELQVQLSGSYRLPLAKMETDDSFCLRDGCHTREEIVVSTSDYTAGEGTKVNPHEMTVAAGTPQKQNPHGSDGKTVPCSTCHTSHRASKGIDYCYDACHHNKTFESCSDCHN